MPNLLAAPPSEANAAPFMGLYGSQSEQSYRALAKTALPLIVPTEYSRTNERRNESGAMLEPPIHIGSSYIANPAFAARFVQKVSRLLHDRHTEANHAPSINRDDDWLDVVRLRMAYLAQLQPDWDSYNGKPPTPIAQHQALGFAHQVSEMFRPLIGERARPASISPLPSGGVELEWQGPTALIAVDIGPDGVFGYLIDRGPDDENQYDEGSGLTGDQLLPRLAEILTRST